MLLGEPIFSGHHELLGIYIGGLIVAVADYKYPIEDCDAVDKDVLGMFREKRAEWVFWLRGDDQHSVWNQIYNMMWNDTVFRIHVNECRRLGEEPSEPRAARNGALARFLDQGYVATQVLAIRRLVEPAAGNDVRQPVSIKRVLRDIRQHRHLLTRENYIAFDGLPYDYSTERRAWYDAHAKELSTGGGVGFHSMATEGPEAWSISADLHEHFDKLSGVDPDCRQRTDVLAEGVFEQISNEIALEEIREIGTYADKFIAHASDPLSRAVVGDREMAISMDKLAKCQKALISASQMICGQLLWDASSSPIPTPQYDVLESLELPWVPKEALEELHGLWHERVKEVESWPVSKLMA
jgi:hypothetical protein